MADDADYGVGVGVHVGADRIDADEVDINPRRCGGGAEGFDGVAGAAVGADDALMLGFFEGVHDRAVARGPIGFGETVHQEDVDVIGLSILSGAHNTLVPQLLELLKLKGMNDVTLLLGGTIPEADIAGLKKAGVAEIFLPGTSTQNIVDFVRARGTKK